MLVHESLAAITMFCFWESVGKARTTFSDKVGGPGRMPWSRLQNRRKIAG
jgi:hypothetical protein